MKLLLTLLLAVQVFALTERQVKTLQTAYSIGQLIVAKDGTTFENTLAAIALTESSAGVNLIGDDRTKAGKKKPLIESSIGCMQIKISTAKELARRYKLISWVDTMSDEALGFRLLASNQTSVLIAGIHIMHYYDVALSRGYYNPWFKTISRYNGGWNNTEYFERVKKNLKTIKRLVKNGALK